MGATGRITRWQVRQVGHAAAEDDRVGVDQVDDGGEGGGLSARLAGSR
jgi:hypothetical protein